MQGKLAILLLVVVATFALPSQKETFKLIRSSSNGLADKIWNYAVYWSPELTYLEAKSYCEDNPLATGAYLAEFETKAEEDDVISTITDFGEPFDRVWLGGKWNGNSSEFVWESGKPLRNNTSWLPGEPSQRNETSRVAAYVASKPGGLLTLQNTSRIGFVCELF